MYFSHNLIKGLSPDKPLLARSFCFERLFRHLEANKRARRRKWERVREISTFQILTEHLLL